MSRVCHNSLQKRCGLYVDDHSINDAHRVWICVARETLPCGHFLRAQILLTKLKPQPFTNASTWTESTVHAPPCGKCDIR